MRTMPFIEKKGFKYLPHTADVKFVAEGKMLDEAFENAAYATFNVIVDTDIVERKIKKTIKIEAKRELSLLYDFLGELLFLLDTDGFLLSKVEKLKIAISKDVYKLDATVSGDIYTEDNKYSVQGNIKSVTYNDMKIEKIDKGYELTVVLDL
ncbi:MAG: archease [Nanoarchaeota archaeon]|nr:archease [Nanoarchaeota archaeon]